MTTYNYTRTKKAGGGYDVENTDRVDGGGTQIYLANEIETALPSKLFTIHCDDTSMDIHFDVALSAGEKTTLDGVVSDHQNNV